MRRALAVLFATVLLGGCAESNLLRGAPTDRTPPTVVATEPAVGAENVTDARISITFSEPMATNTVEIRSTPSLTWGTGTWSNGDRTVTFIPSDLRPNTQYTITVTGRDRAGNAMTQAFTLRFTTGSIVQTGAVAHNLLQNRVAAGVDERVYAVFLAWIAASSDRNAARLTEEQRELRMMLERTAPSTVRKVREYFVSRPIGPTDLTAFALRLGPDLQLGSSPRPVTPLGAPASLQPGSSPAPITPSAPAAPSTPSPQPAQEDAARRLTGFDALVRELYQEAKGQELWRSARTAHEREAVQLRDATQDRLRQAATYLRLTSVPFTRLLLVPNLLAPREEVTEAWAGDVLHVLVGPSPGPNVRGVVRSFIRVVVAPVVESYRDLIAQSRELFELVKDELQARGWTRWDDAVRESLVRAVEAKLFLPNPDEQSQFLDATFAEGFVLVRHFAERLSSLERGEVNLARFVETSLRDVNVQQIRQHWHPKR